MAGPDVASEWEDVPIPNDDDDFNVEVGLPVVPGDWTLDQDVPAIDAPLEAEDHLRAIAYWERRKAEATAHSEAVIFRQAQPIIDRANRRAEVVAGACQRKIEYHAVALRGYAGNDLRSRKKSTGYGVVRLVNGEIKKTEGRWKTEVLDGVKWLADRGDMETIAKIETMIEQAKAKAPFVRLKLSAEPNIKELGAFCLASGTVPDGATYTKGPDTWSIKAAPLVY